VTGGVYTHEVVLEGRDTTLHVAPEGLDVLAVEQLGDHLVVGPLARRPRGDVTLETARIGSKTKIGVEEVSNRIRRSAQRVSKDRPQVDRPVLERAGRHAASSSALRNFNQR